MNGGVFVINPNQQAKDRLTIRVNHQRKQDADAIAKEMGTDLPNLVNIFIAQLVKESGLPFRPTTNSVISELNEALADVKAGRVTKFNNADELFSHLQKLDDSVND